MGFVFGVTSALCFAVGAIFFKMGQQTRPSDDGHLLANFLNATVLGVCSLFVARQSWSTTGFAALVAGGIVGTVLGRFALLRGIRLIGPTRANTFQTATPVSAAIVGWIVLGERLEPLEALGGAISIYGLVRIVQDRGPVSDGEPVPLTSYLIAGASPAFFGVAFVLRKWGLERLPGALIGAFIGSLAGLLVLALWEAGRGRLRPLVRSTLTDPPWAYIAAGVVTAGALLTQFLSLERIDAWVVGILGGTVAIWTPLLSLAVPGQTDTITVVLLANIGLVFAGVVIIAVA